MEKMTAAQFKAKSKKRRADREGPIHIKILKHLRETFPQSYVVHTKNEINRGGKLFAREISKAKTMGLVTGWPDLTVIRPYPSAPLFFEVKAEGNYASTAQKEVHANLTHMGHKVAVVRSVEDVNETLREWGI